MPFIATGAFLCSGETAEWSNAVVLKTINSKGSRVRIPVSPPNLSFGHLNV